MVSRVIQVSTFDLVVFGATGDLARRKIFPALFNRLVAGQMPEDAVVICIARKKISLDNFKSLVKESIFLHSKISVEKEKLAEKF